MAAMQRFALGMQRLVARLRPRHDLHQQAADAEPGNVLARHRQPGEEPHQHPVETVFLGASRAARRAEHRAAVGGADHHQVAGIDRHAEMLDHAADILQRRRDHVAAVGDRGSAEHHHQFRTGFEHLVDRLGERRALMRHAPLGDDRGAGGRQPVGGDLQRLVDHFGGEPRQQRRDHADLANAIRRDPHQRRLGAGDRGVARRFGDAERNDLDRRDHLAGDHRLIGRQRRERDRLVDAVEPIDGVLVDDEARPRTARTDWRGR